MQHCDAKCGQCARNFWKWTKARMAQMRVPKTYKDEDGKVLRKDTISFDEAAATSVKAPKAGEDCPTYFNFGATVMYKDREHTVTFDARYVGADGTHWVYITDGKHAMHVPCGILVLKH